MVKKLLIIILIISILFLVSCTNLDNYVPVEEYDELHSAYVEAKQDRTVLENENKSLKSDIDNLENEVEKYKNLLNNLNGLLNNVYYVYGDNGETYVFGTGFSIEYEGKYYLITAGHAVDGEWGIHKNLGFKDIKGEWIYPELLTYKVTDTVPDYAIYYSNEINDGFKYDLDNSEPDYRLGIDEPIQDNDNEGISGECGSPIINLEGEVIGIYIGYLQDIDLVIEAIDNLE